MEWIIIIFTFLVLSPLLIKFILNKINDKINKHSIFEQDITLDEYRDVNDMLNEFMTEKDINYIAFMKQSVTSKSHNSKKIYHYKITHEVIRNDMFSLKQIINNMPTHFFYSDNKVVDVNLIQTTTKEDLLNRSKVDFIKNLLNRLDFKYINTYIYKLTDDESYFMILLSNEELSTNFKKEVDTLLDSIDKVM